MTTEEMSSDLYVKGIPESLKRKFKAACAANGNTMSKEIIKLIQNFVERTQK